METPTAHIEAKKEDIAKIVIMPGDPLRAKLFSEEYMTNVKKVNSIRGMLAYTGYINERRVTVMGHGMGLESIGIYSFELYKFYDVDVIIRFGSAGSYSKDVNILDMIIAEEAWTKSNYGEAYGANSDTLSASKRLVDISYNIAQKIISDPRKVIKGKINSSMWFYKTDNLDSPEEMVNNNIIAVEMEAYSLYAIAKALNKEALTILTISDNIVTNEVLSADDRRTKFGEMFKVISEITQEI